MKFLTVAFLAALTLGTASAQTQIRTMSEHGGGNGGDDLELDLKKKSLQIGYFLKSTIGSKVFNSLNADAVLDSINRTDIDVVSGNVTDRYGVIRTCVNEENRGLITCNLDRLNELKKGGKNDIILAILFHEILGMMGLELGFQENVSLYPVSSKILPYAGVVEATPVSEANIRPEYFGLDNTSYGIIVENKETKESLRMICLNDNVEIHRCRNFSVVRNANKRQAPLVPSIISLSPQDLAALTANSIIRSSSSSKAGDREAIKLVNGILNLGNDLSLVGQTTMVSDKVYRKTVPLLMKVVEEKVIRVEREKEVADAAVAAEEKELRIKKEKEDRLAIFDKDFKGNKSERICQRNVLENDQVLNDYAIDFCTGLTEKSYSCVASAIAYHKYLRINYDTTNNGYTDSADAIYRCKKIK
jgi:hypothetical protein